MIATQEIYAQMEQKDNKVIQYYREVASNLHTLIPINSNIQLLLDSFVEALSIQTQKIHLQFRKHISKYQK